MCNLRPFCCELLTVQQHYHSPTSPLSGCRWARKALGPANDLEIQPAETCTLRSDLCLGQGWWQAEQLSRSGLFVMPPSPCTFPCL